MANNEKILVIDDEQPIRKLLVSRFERDGFTVIEAENGAEGVTMAKKHNPKAIITDIKMPEMDGFEFIESLRKDDFKCPVIVITGHGDKECAIEAIHKGAFDYIEKPFEMNQIAIVLKRAVERENLRLSNISLIKDLEVANKKLEGQLEVKSELLERVTSKQDQDRLIGFSSHIESIRQMIKTISENYMGSNDPVVLITGESGVGKEVVAKSLHEAVFGKEKPFIAINCAAFPDNLLESELFGYEKGAFTGALSRKLGLFELASGGTLFMDEIGEMDLKMQAKLLRVLQERMIRRLGGTSDIAIRPHIVAATNRDLSKAVADQTFREDLFYRLNTIPLAVAPLRSRTEDIEVLAEHFLKLLSAGRNKKFTGFSDNAKKALLSYRWPGNVRELRSIIERAVILEKGPKIELSQLRQESLHSTNSKMGSTNSNVLSISQTQDPWPNAWNEIEGKGLSEYRKEVDDKVTREILIECMKKEMGNVSSVARTLKLDRANLLRLLKRHTIEPELFRTTDSMKKAG